ncbi:MAG: amidohydrolase family protein [Acidimicrobiia bacterium]|nr:amidohydrolase family protein [Acidimicrobiia bacterium]
MVLRNIGVLCTNDRRFPGVTGRVDGGAVAIRDGRILWAGPSERLPQGLSHLPALDCGGRAVIPGFVDAHTHLLFATHRRQDFERRLLGSSDEEIMLAGGGAAAIAGANDKAGLAAIEAAAFERLRSMLATGTTTVEIKSGYGCSATAERNLLEIAASLDRRQPIDIITTLHAGAAGALRHEDGPKAFVEEFIAEILPACAGAAVYCSIGCDDGVFSASEARLVLEEATGRGLRPRVSAGPERAHEAIKLAAIVAASTVDHLLSMTPDDVAVLRDGGQTAVLTPADSFLRRRRPGPGKPLWMAGVPVALATGCNASSSNVLRMPFIVALAVLEMGLTPDQALWSATRGGALAIEELDKGWIGHGADADLVILDADDPAQLAYRPDDPLIWKVFKSGDLVAS